ncbi:hydantoinase B/oxoprolinase family protein [Amycolatopsis pithecellobii]|uniref:Hydantoinase B/oxoprolinase domain-containing protein n=1 Tax=Amycolatopsis pithecellobii TaxID=664692 RepID=A0A6N7Z0G1_9PSEU|nr:hydantoinase B/oxoprolinase family protein [Amycolatopsis pithecellobii]MTD53060.1 hypothetical protein [Amycolatopsis pithecellobii]
MPEPTGDKMDEVVVKVAWDRLMALANSAATSVYRTAFSPTVQDLVDIALAFVDRHGRLLIVSDIGSTGHMAPIAAVCQEVMRAYPAESMREGDVYVLNDPWVTSGHLLDVAVVAPIFRNSRLVGAAGAIFHATDIGGLGITSWANDIYEEGLYLPPVKLVAAGQRNEELYQVMLANVRRPEYFAGDLEAAITGIQIGAQGVERLLDELDLEDLDALSDEIIDRSERAMRDALRQLRPGEYSASVEFDPLGPGSEPLDVRVRVTVDDDANVVVDYAGTCDEVRRGVNSTLVYTAGYSQYAVRLAVTNRLPWNAGTMAPIKVVAPEGSIVACKHPAPTAMRTAIGQNVTQLVLRALTDAEPPFLAADSCGPDVMAHFNPDEGVAPEGRVTASCGQGARRHRDGLVATTFPARARRKQIELTEQEGYVRYLRQERRAGSGGAGRTTGGDGMIVEFEFVRCGATVDVLRQRTHMPPQGLLGGGEGLPSNAELNGEVLPSRFRGRVEVGDRLLLESAGGGGMGAVTETGEI